MSLVAINNVTVLGGSVVRPRKGVWSADLRIDQNTNDGFSAGTKVAITSDDGFELDGVVDTDRTGDFIDAVHVRVLGGAGGMSKTASARSYAQPGAFVSDVVNGFIADSGETLSEDTDAGFLATNLVAWTVFADQTVGAALEALIEFVAPSMTWRILSNGKLWIGAESWPSASPTFEIIESNPTEGYFELGVDSPSIEPGTTLDGIGQAARIEHLITAEKIRDLVWTNLPSAPRGPEESIRAIVAKAVGSLDYFGLYECKVLAQSADFSTVDVQPLPPVDAKLSGLQRVEVRAGTGVTVQFAPGAKVLLGWKGGDPRAPYVVPGLGADRATSIQIAGKAHPFLPGSASELGTLTLTVGGSATLSWQYVDGNGVTTSGASGAPITLTGKQATVVGVG